MFQFDFDVFYERAVYPFLGSCAAGLTDDGAEIALSEAHLLGIETDLMLACSVLVHQIDETVENSLLTRLRGLRISLK